jgi:hypothetical protein
MPDMGLKEARRILGVRADADGKEIKSRFRELVSKHHPDHGGDVKMFKRVATAYDTIMNWGGTDIVARKVEDGIFDSMWDEWLRKLSPEDQDKVAEDLERIEQEG